MDIVNILKQLTSNDVHEDDQEQFLELMHNSFVKIKHFNRCGFYPQQNSNPLKILFCYMSICLASLISLKQLWGQTTVLSEWPT